MQFGVSEYIWVQFVLVFVLQDQSPDRRQQIQDIHAQLQPGQEAADLPSDLPGQRAGKRQRRKAPAPEALEPESLPI